MRFLLIFSTIVIVSLNCNTVPLDFDGEKAYNYLLEQCQFGPRNPGSKGHAATKKYITNNLSQLADSMFIQNFTYNIYGLEGEYEGANIIARFNPKANFQVLIGAHWDTRPFADRDDSKENINKPIIGANDGASGVAILLELAIILNNHPPSIGVNLVFFDAEDSGRSGINESYCKGSIYFSKNLPILGLNEAIILDMVGDKQLSLPIERYSYKYHPKLVRSLWDRAKELSLSAFKGSLGPAIYDDHMPLNEYAGIPAIDIIDFRYPNSHENYWHTTNDTPDKCSAKSLEQVGKLMVDYIYNRKFYSQ